MLRHLADSFPLSLLKINELPLENYYIVILINTTGIVFLWDATHLHSLSANRHSSRLERDILTE